LNVFHFLVASQTTLSLPPVLPLELEELLKPYFNRDDDNEDIDLSEEASDEEGPMCLSQSSLRRKLMFIQEEVLETNCPSSPMVVCVFIQNNYLKYLLNLFYFRAF
jgi:Protein aurora borealis N-terminus